MAQMQTSIHCRTNHWTEIQVHDNKLSGPIALSSLQHKCFASRSRCLGLCIMISWGFDPHVKDLVTFHLRRQTALWLHYVKLALVRPAPLDSILLWAVQVGPQAHHPPASLSFSCHYRHLQSSPGAIQMGCHLLYSSKSNGDWTENFLISLNSSSLEKLMIHCYFLFITLESTSWIGSSLNSSFTKELAFFFTLLQRILKWHFVSKQF